MRVSVGLVLCLADAVRSRSETSGAALEPNDVAEALLRAGEGFSPDVLRSRLAADDLKPLGALELSGWLRAALVHAAELARRDGRQYYGLNDLCGALLDFHSDALAASLVAALGAARGSLPDLDEPNVNLSSVVVSGTARFGFARVARRERGGRDSH